MAGVARKVGRWLRDAAERVGATFVESFIGALGALQLADVEGPTGLHALEAAAFSAALAALKALVARRVGDPASASLLPAVGVDAPEPADAGHEL